jgi:hypothetical protein
VLRSPQSLCSGTVCSGGLRLRVRPEVPSLPLGRTQGETGLLPSSLREELLRSGLLRSPQGLCPGTVRSVRSGGLCPSPLCPSGLRLRVRPEVPSLPVDRVEGQVGLLLPEELLRPGVLRSTQGLRSGLLCPGLLQIT